MLDNYDGVIFDMDGTLIDSMWVWRKVDEEFLYKRNKEVPADLQKQIEGLSFTETAIYFKNKFLLCEEIEEIKSEWVNMVKGYYETIIPLKEGAYDLISCLKSKGMKVGLATSNSRDLTELILKRTHIYDFFDTIVTSCEIGKDKSFPDIFLLTAKNLGVSPYKCVVFEDSLSGIKGAKSAGMEVIAVYDEYSAAFKNELKRSADTYIHSLLEIA